MLRSKNNQVLGVVVFSGALFVTPAKSEGVITFQGMIVESSCELNINSVECLETDAPSIKHSVAHFNVNKQALLVGESKQLRGRTKKIDEIDIVRVDKDKYLVTAIYF
ncbi:type 1 fimbrial protein [Shewanella sp. DNRA4]|uniref:type 1 fimbrial protein n=1 Tax=Shewanella sp. DNRA4 TaxID=2723055 RepID=UPI00146D6EF8|nr:type 1 fimbrial protein [Shewanella sp. DNRA4]NMD51104.1 type 1 fimbrial protein [Shewanella sp. DNRA4]